jgi:hypothetical protein
MRMKVRITKDSAAISGQETMTFLNKSDIDRLLPDLAVANSASFLFRRYFQDPVVSSLALRAVAELEARVKEVHGNNEAHLPDVVDGYAAAVALLRAGQVAIVERIAGQPGKLSWLSGLAKSVSGSKLGNTGVKTVSANAYRIQVTDAPMFLTTSGLSVRSVQSKSKQGSEADVSVLVSG